MVAEKSTIVIAHGAWQLAVGYELFAATLRDNGFDAIVPPLPSVGGTVSPLPGLPEDMAAVKGVLTKVADEGKEIILLCHSYGGIVGSGAVDGVDVASRAKEGKKGGVRKVVYMAAFILTKGKSTLDLLGGPTPWMRIEGEKTFAGSDDTPSEVGFSDLPPERATFHRSQMTHISSSVFIAPATFEPWTEGIPCAYIFTAEDAALPYPVQLKMSSQLGAEAETYTLKSGHCPFLSMPNQLLEVIEKIART